MSLADIQAMKALKLAKQNAVNLDTVVRGRTVNMFNKSDLIGGKFYYATVGSLVTLNTSANWSTLTTPLPVKAGDVVNYNLAYQNSYFVGVDNNNTVIQGVTVLTPAGAKSVTVANGVTKVYISVYNSNIDNFMVTINNPMPTQYTPYYINSSKWSGKSYVMIGDSITWQDGQAYTQGNVGAIAKGYGTLLKNKTGLSSLTNYGISGASMARNSSYPTNGSSCVDGLTRDFSIVDLVTIASGTNDFKLNVPLGTKGVIGDTTFDDTTFYGAYRKLIEYILTQKPTIKILLFTPIQRDNGGYDVNFSNSTGNKLNDYRNAIIAIGEMYGLPVLDLYAKSGITKFTLSTYLMDGLHPNDTGYARMSELINPFAENN